MVGRTQPARLAIGVFALVIAVVTALLSLPAATTSGQRAPFIDALFTATSAVCVTGLTTVNTGTYWSPFGQIVIGVAIKVGGLGVITIAALLGLMVSRRLGLTGRLLAQQETKSERLGEVGSLLRFVDQPRTDRRRRPAAPVSGPRGNPRSSLLARRAVCAVGVQQCGFHVS
jgi:Trk-type K+ transport system membrane component